jgi:hypothetical protein
MGWVASRFGIAEAMVLGGVACALIGAGAFAWVRRSRAAMVVESRPDRRPIPAGAVVPSAARPR